MSKIIEEAKERFRRRFHEEVTQHNGNLSMESLCIALEEEITHAIEAHDKKLAEKVKFEIAGLAGMSNQIQDSGQAHIFEMKLGNILALLNKQI